MYHLRFFGVAVCLAASMYTLAQTAPLIPMRDIPAGHYYMGGDGWGENWDEVPTHRVTLTRGFRMGITEVTNAQYEQFRPDHRALRGRDGVSFDDDEAVVNVSYQDAVDFCQWLSRREGRSYRLPTEAEWEYACRAGSYTLFSTGDGLPGEQHRHQQMVRDFTHVSLRVAQNAPNAWGLHDMHGGVEEWCQDWYGLYTADDQQDPGGPQEGIYRVTRGGSHHTPEGYLRSANRMAMIPEDRHSQTGFRVVESDVQPTPSGKPEPLPLVQQGVSQERYDWTEKKREDILCPIPFVIAPDDGTPFYRHNHQPAVTWCDNGDLLATWFSANDENGREMVVLGSRLRAGHDQWDKASLFFRVPDRNVTGTALLNDGHGTLYHLNGVEASGSWQNLAVCLRTSSDNGATWSAPRLVAPRHAKRHQIVAGTLLTREGYIVQACDAGPGGSDGGAVQVSRDGGETWQDPWDGAPLPHFGLDTVGTTAAGIHLGITQLRDGSLMALGRSNNIADSTGQPRMPMSISHDMGRTWHYQASPLPPIDGGQRLVLMRLREGPLLVVSFTDHPQRTPIEQRGMDFGPATHKGYGLYAALSWDEGKTWPVRRLLTDGREHFLNGGAWTGSFLMDADHAEPRGYLCGTQSPDGTIHILSSRLHYRFTMEWVMRR